MKPAWYPGDGRHIGYCTRCGRDVFNTNRPHRCPKKIARPLFAAIVAAKEYRDARQGLATTTAGTLRQHQAAKTEAEKFAALEAALAALERE